MKDNFLKLNNYQDVIIILASFTFISYLCIKIIQRYSKAGIERYLLAFLVLIAAFFNYGPIVDSLGGLLNPYLKATYIWLFASGLMGYGAWKISRSLEIQKATKLLISIVVAIPILEIGHSYWFRPIPLITEKKNEDLSFAFKHKPNVYYLLVDAYARQDTLKEVAGFDNEPFLHDLEQKGFIVCRNSYSNYHFTGASLPATMNMNYHKSEEDGSIDYNSQMHESLKGDNLVRKIFKDNAYKIINVPAHWHQMTCYGYEDKCLMKPSFEVYESFLSKTPMRFFQLKVNYVSFKDIKKAVHLFPRDPKFIFAHLAQVHDAIYDELGNYQSTLHPGFSNIQEAQCYVNSIKVINNKLLDLIEYIHEHDKNSIIIIQADHGPTYTGNLTPKDIAYWLAHTDDIRLKSKDHFRYTFGIISAIYLPPSIKTEESTKKNFLNDLSLINTFRYLFAYLSEQEPQPLKGESHFLYYDHKASVYREDDITHFKN